MLDKNIDYNEFSDICPFSDEEAVAALSKVADHPYVLAISKYLFPNESPFFLRKSMKNITSIDEFQQLIMKQAVAWVLENTVDNFSYTGIEHIKAIEGKYLAMSNHRDIILDPAFTQYVLAQNNIPLTQIAVGDNLLSHKSVERLLRSNRMIKVIRGISARELYLSSQLLSKYIRSTVTSGTSSVWIAQRQGRTKDGTDITEQGLLKMIDMSGKAGFVENFSELNIVPMSISYEYEPCDIKKARELLISKSGPYVKRKSEDLHSIMTGIRQKKGNVNLTICEPITREEIEYAATESGNDRYRLMRQVVDKKVIMNYKLWKTNYMAFDLVNNTDKYFIESYYSKEDLEAFKSYVEHKLNKVERKLNRNELRQIFLNIYANPVVLHNLYYVK